MCSWPLERVRPPRGGGLMIELRSSLNLPDAFVTIIVQSEVHPDHFKNLGPVHIYMVFYR